MDRAGLHTLVQCDKLSNKGAKDRLAHGLWETISRPMEPFSLTFANIC